MISQERTIALGKYESLKKDFRELAVRAGSHLQTLREQTDTLLTDKDFMSINFDNASVLIDELKEIQSSAKEMLAKIDELKRTYKFD